MALNFPDSPADGQVYTDGLRSWQYNSADLAWYVILYSPNINWDAGSPGSVYGGTVGIDAGGV